MTEDRRGQIVTFYSYKGGTGRTMALANVAWILAASGKRVLVADWDLESPGLHRFFSPFIDLKIFDQTTGLIDLIRDYEWATTSQVERDDRWHEQFANVHRHAFSLEWTYPEGGCLDFLSAGRQNNDYASTVYSLDWDNFYDKLGGGLFFDALRENMKREYDYTLIDSRTGLSDVADICTIHLPDVLVDCFTFSEQGIDGAARVARNLQRRYDARAIRILPVPMRVDLAEKAKADAGRSEARRRFPGLPSGMTAEQRDAYWAAVQIPYQAYYAYEETLAVFGDLPGSSQTLLSAYEALTRYITEGAVATMPMIDAGTRARIIARFTRQPVAVEEEVTLQYAPEDQLWAEWIQHVLVAAGVRVNDPWVAGASTEEPSASGGRILTIVSRANADAESAVVPSDPHGGREPLAIYVADLAPLPHLPIANTASIVDLSADAAADRLLRLVGRDRSSLPGTDLQRGARFPGNGPLVFSAPARNPRFTGREDDLRQLRAQLRAGGAAVVVAGSMPVALHGLGGIGKTQVAMEYAYRFRAAYDVVWWISSDPVTFVDVAIEDLGKQLRLPTQANVPESVQAVLQALGRGEPYPRWLVIFDNADDPELLGRFIPQGSGHVLITSRNSSWGDRARAIEVDIFERRESVAHLCQRVKTLKVDEARRIAEALGDLPIAVAAAGAWLADTMTPIDVYLRRLEELGPAALEIEKTWDLSLQRLRERSLAAYRLLQLCSVTAPEIALELVYSDQLSSALTEIDPRTTDRMFRATLVQHINRLALIKLDSRTDEVGQGDRTPSGQIVVHRLLQHVVRERMSKEEQERARHEIHIMLAASRPRGEVDDPRTWPDFRLLWPHLQASEAASSENEAVRQLMIDRVRYLWLVGDLVNGSETARGIESRWRDLLAESSGAGAEALRRQLLHLRFNLANILRDQARFTESKELDEAVLAEQLELLGPDHPHTLLTAGGLGGDLRGLGRYPEALARDELTHATWLDQFGEDHPRTLTALSNLAVSNRLMGDFRAALERDEAVYDKRQRVLGEEHPDTLRSAGNVARDLREAGEYEKSLEILRRVADGFRKTLGERSRAAYNADANLAVSLRAVGNASDAAKLLESAHEGLNRTPGPARPDTLACRLSLAVNLFSIGKLDRADRELEDLRQAYEQSLGEKHPHTLVCINNRAAVLRGLGRREVSRDLAATASDALQNVLGRDHPYALAALTNLAICVAEGGDEAGAAPLMEIAADRITATLGPDHPDAVRARANLALLRRHLGQPGSDAEVSSAMELLARKVGQQHPTVQALREGRYLHRMLDPHPY